MSPTIKGPWQEPDIEEFLLQSAFPMRLACVASDGFPRVVSVWYGYSEGNLFCVSHQSSQLVSLLERSNKVGFEVAPNEPPYHGVRGQGTVSLGSDAEGRVLADLLQRYLGDTRSPLADWLLSRAADEVLITIAPTRLFSWDYRERM